jgi:diketogulonate reductase-like aldo/keto reductase
LQHGDLVDFCRKNEIAVEAYAPLTAITKATPGPVDPIYEALAKKYGVTGGEIALRWCLDQGIIAITTSSNELRLQTYMRNVPAFKLTPREIEDIAKAGEGKHFRGFWGAKFSENDRR